MHKALLDWGPILVFFIAFKLEGIYVATALSIVVSLLLMAWVRSRGHAIEKMQWVGLGLIVVFGGLTLLLQDERFIKWKPTLLYGISALVLFVPQVLGRAIVLKSLLGEKLELPDAQWRGLNLAWAGFFAFMAILNLWVAQQFSTDIWVDFKLFGGIGLLLAFVLAQSWVLSRLASKTAPHDDAVGQTQPESLK